jgi:predicted unusual protein kinase regulating ubiquinone biosynthesis (AarF/ABC1/UbiB family)
VAQSQPIGRGLVIAARSMSSAFRMRPGPFVSAGTRPVPARSSAMPADPPAGRPLPGGRLSRLSRFGGLATGIAGRVAAEGARKLVAGERPRLHDLLLTPANVRRVTDQLAELRGAAMKVGQLLSIDAGDMLPAELTAILARLRADGEPMPDRQLGQVLAAEWGLDWKGKLAAFDAKPIAAASIGQVHRARAKDGRDLAIKIQYPGVARSIGSDVDNVATLLRLSGLVPRGIDTVPLLAEAKRQLHEEADYLREAACLGRYRDLVARDPGFVLPELVPELTTPRILAMTYVPGTSLDTLETAPQATRDDVARRLVALVLAELFAWGWMQSDPNPANYRWQPETGRIVLLDFGATQPVAPDAANLYRRLLRAARDGDREEALAGLTVLGLVDDRTAPAHRDELVALVDLAGERLLRQGPFDFADPSLLATLRDRGLALARDKAEWRAPPPDTLFLQRKLGGTYHLCARLKARVDLAGLAAGYI